MNGNAKECCIWFSKLRNAWILDIDEPGDRRFPTEQEAVEVAKKEGCNRRYICDEEGERSVDL